MAGFDYLGTRETADKLIKKFGMKAALRRYDNSLPDRDCWVCIYNYMPSDKATALSNPTDRQVLMSAGLGDVPNNPPDNEKDQLVTFIQPAGLVQNEVLPFTCPVKIFAPAGIIVLYEFTVRQ